uniref:VDR-b-like nuclear receptor n=1 Tax=Phallusia mammillata TaxID=59560 RepID=A0A6F9DX42_9ASCI|nr:VDR-b-like nuclear receptor [Phallusia mammillata]
MSNSEAKSQAAETETKEIKGTENKNEKTALKICVICGDKATGMHFGAMSCEGCKGFFRRSMKKNANFTCAFEKNCGINKKNRRHCQACRLEACLDAGMKSHLILSDEEVHKKRELIEENRKKRREQQQQKKEEQEQRMKQLAAIGAEQPQAMTDDDKEFIQTLLKGHQESYDFGYKEFDTFRGREQVKSPGSQHTSSSTLAWLVASLSNPGDVKSSMNVRSQRPTDPADVQHNVQTCEASEDSNSSDDKVSDMSRVFSSLHGNATSQIDSDLENSNSTENPIKEEKEKVGTSKCDDFPPDEGDSLAYIRGLLRSQGFSLSLVEDSKSKQLLQHFCDIMTWGIKKVIDFCKSIPAFLNLSIVDQIVLLRGGCLEMLVLRSYFAFSSEDNKYTSDKFQYKPSDFLQAGASKEFVEKYNSLHVRMRKMKLQVEEICLLLALVLFSPDRPGLEEQSTVEEIQGNVAKTLHAYEYSTKTSRQARTMYSELLLILPILRTINMLFATNLMSLQASNGNDMNPLILEVNSTASEVD